MYTDDNVLSQISQIARDKELHFLTNFMIDVIFMAPFEKGFVTHNQAQNNIWTLIPSVSIEWYGFLTRRLFSVTVAFPLWKRFNRVAPSA